MVRVPKFQIALAILAEKNKLLVIENAKNYLDLPGNQIVLSNKAVTVFEQLLVELGLNQMPHQILYLSQLELASIKQRVIRMVGLIHLKKPQQIDISDGQFESVEKLRSTKRLTPLLKAVLEWLI